ncbi:hypothetical protein IRT45_05855 [Nocardia sp. BSTN01]|uniref:hypothetical protein n=1 Tax=Nocardia sp. BSTN01 TaxID=2783665 RepID=UPI00188F4D5B|nr:hypothetical protein [Nocardia sp. BSTN01]MBF4996678.1 hypothetical protein [Nocardia sp. BSTN01]
MGSPLNNEGGIVLQAASISAIDFTAAAIWSALGTSTTVYINDLARISTNRNSEPFDSRRGLATGQLMISPDGTVRQLYAPIFGRSLKLAISDVSFALQRSLPSHSPTIRARETMLIAALPDAASTTDPRVILLTGIYRCLGLGIGVGSVSDMVVSGLAGERVLAALDRCCGNLPDGNYRFRRGGQIELLLPGKPSSVFDGLAVERGQAVFFQSADGDRTLLRNDFKEIRPGRIRLRGPLDILYADILGGIAGHLPWHIPGARPGAGALVVHSIVSPPARVGGYRAVGKLLPGGYMLIDYPGSAGLYAEEKLSTHWLYAALRVTLENAVPVREKFSKSQKAARDVSNKILCAGELSLLGLPFSSLGLIVSAASNALKSRNYHEFEVEWGRHVRSLLKIGGEFQDILHSFELRNFAVRNLTVNDVLRNLQTIFASTSSPAQREIGVLKASSLLVCESIVALCMIISESVLRADMLRLFLLGLKSEDFRSLAGKRELAPYDSCYPLLLTRTDE